MSHLESNSPIWSESLLIKIHDICLKKFWSYGYGRRPKFFRADHSDMAEGENWAYGPTLQWHHIFKNNRLWNTTHFKKQQFQKTTNLKNNRFKKQYIKKQQISSYFFKHNRFEKNNRFQINQLKKTDIKKNRFHIIFPKTTDSKKQQILKTMLNSNKKRTNFFGTNIFLDKFLGGQFFETKFSGTKLFKTKFFGTN